MRQKPIAAFFFLLAAGLLNAQETVDDARPETPAFEVSPGNILETRTRREGGRTLTVRKINPIQLPGKNPNPPAPGSQEKPPASGDVVVEDEAISISATVHRFPDNTVRSRVRVSLVSDPGKTVAFRSSADFSLLSGLGSFTGSGGSTRAFFMGWSVHDPEAMDNGPGGPPDFPAGKATFTPVSEKPFPKVLEAIRSLHNFYNREHGVLLAAARKREIERRKREAELLANPPKPKDLTISYWEINRPAPAKGGAR